MTGEFDVEGDTAVITGGSRGIGKAIAERFARNGTDVVVCSRTYGDVADAAAEIEAGADGARAVPVECDVRDWDAVEALVETTVEEFGGLDVLVNNVGTNTTAPFEELSEENWRTVLETNLTGAFICTRVAGDRMLAGDGGTIVNISGGASRWGLPEWADEDVRVNAIAPGPILTERMAEYLGADPSAVDTGEVDRVLGTPDEIAAVAQFLASPAASFVSGETLFVTGPPRIPELDLHSEVA